MQRHLSIDMCWGWKNLRLYSIILLVRAVIAFDQETWEGEVADAVKYRFQVDVTAFKHKLVVTSTKEVNYSAFLL